MPSFIHRFEACGNAELCFELAGNQQSPHAYRTTAPRDCSCCTSPVQYNPATVPTTLPAASVHATTAAHARPCPAAACNLNSTAASSCL
ncbi:hypothetical protein E2562_039426 [Oryza meyeriana var. granulata]|uniref:Uncharacterized protein n=1 Tax=Oryza meyeriana var. granulata TaxID=110450 RepID=A0A6G1CY03_9ORYZ|nr:hypothetical protein E2562_039426 [Oryza meyeriana var. granulata]